MGNYLNLPKEVGYYLDNCPPSLDMPNKIVNFAQWVAEAMLETRPG